MKSCSITILILAFVGFSSRLCAADQASEKIAADILAPLLVPAKVDTLKGDRPANSRLYKILFWLETARRSEGDVSRVIDSAQTEAGYGDTKRATADKVAILWSMQNLET